MLLYKKLQNLLSYSLMLGLITFRVMRCVIRASVWRRVSDALYEFSCIVTLPVLSIFAVIWGDGECAHIDGVKTTKINGDHFVS